MIGRPGSVSGPGISVADMKIKGRSWRWLIGVAALAAAECAVVAAIEIVSRSNPENDWVGKMRDYPLLGIPIYVIFDPRTGSGAVFTDIHSTPEGPRYAVRKNFVYGEDVTIGEWTISTSGLPRYQDDGAEEAES